MKNHSPHRTLRRPSQALRQTSFWASRHDLHFLASSATYLGISRGELLRRLLFAARERWLQAGLYSAPKDLTVFPGPRVIHAKDVSVPKR